MPSPFPGMDPYLENIVFWKSVQHDLIALITFALNEILPEPFLARSEGRSYILPQQELIYPDAIIVRDPSEDAPLPAKTATTASVATENTPLIFEFSTQEIWEPHVQILSVEDEQLVTLIEVLSPTNKIRESTGRDEYLRKQKQILQSDTHLVEIDLLRSGQHTVAIPREAVAAQKAYDYLISLRRAGLSRQHFEVWAVTIRESLPRIRIPLTSGWADLELDLQNIVGEVYRRGRWQKAIDYRLEAEPSLAPADQDWANTLLTVVGLRV